MEEDQAGGWMGGRVGSNRETKTGAALIGV